MGNKAELNSSLDKKYGKDTDLIFNGSYAQLKQPSGTPTSIDTALRSDQADLIIIELKEKPDRIARLEGKIKYFVTRHPVKKVILQYENNFKEYGND